MVIKRSLHIQIHPKRRQHPLKKSPSVHTMLTGSVLWSWYSYCLLTVKPENSRKAIASLWSVVFKAKQHRKNLPLHWCHDFHLYHFCQFSSLFLNHCCSWIIFSTNSTTFTIILYLKSFLFIELWFSHFWNHVFHPFSDSTGGNVTTLLHPAVNGRVTC